MDFGLKKDPFWTEKRGKKDVFIPLFSSKIQKNEKVATFGDPIRSSGGGILVKNTKF